MKAWWLGFFISLWLILTVNFLLPRWLPGDPLSGLIDPSSSAYVFDDDTRSELEAYYGLDRPLLSQYADYLSGIWAGDMGYSIRLHQPVNQLIRDHLPWTLLLTLTSLSLAALMALILGSEAAWHRGRLPDRLLVALSVMLSNAPVFFSGMLLLLFFGVVLGWLPLAGGRTPFASYANPWAEVRDYGEHLILPALTLTLALLGVQALLIRNSMVGVLGEDYMLVARAKGLSKTRLKWHHALRNALLPFVHHLAAHAGFAFTGALFIETLFSYPGLGKLIFESVVARDYPVIQGIFVIVSVCVICANALADLLSRFIDPRLASEAV